MITCHRSSLMPEGFELVSDFDTTPPLRHLVRLCDRAQVELTFSLEGAIMKGAQIKEEFEAEVGPTPENVVPFEDPDL